MEGPEFAGILSLHRRTMARFYAAHPYLEGAGTLIGRTPEGALGYIARQVDRKAAHHGPTPRKAPETG